MNNYRNADYDDDEWQDTVYIGGWRDVPTIPCPYCRRDILEDALMCRYCQRYISKEDNATPGKHPWMILTALVCLGAVGCGLVVVLGALIPPYDPVVF